MDVLGLFRKRFSRNGLNDERLKAPGETCPRCGEHPIRLFHHGRATKQQRTEVWTCANAECNTMRTA
jgi:ribosomal protein S27AE